MSQAPGGIAGSDSEICRVYCRGQIFSGWTAISIKRSTLQLVSTCTLEITEPQQTGAKAKWVDWQIKPGDPVKVTLGGALAFTGHVEQRQAAYDANQHGVQIIAASYTQDAVDCSVVPDAGGGRYAGYTVDKIAAAVLKPFKIALKTVGDMGKAFPVVQLLHGETAFELIERLARMRGLDVHDDENGTMVLSKGNSGQSHPALIEGQNILSATGRLGYQGYSDVTSDFQQTGNDHQSGDASAQVTATVKNPKVTRHRPLIIVGEQPGDADDAKSRAKMELSRTLAETVVVSVVVQGWFASPGVLWTPKAAVPVKSPMLLLDMTLYLQTVEWRQSSNEGTQTLLDLVTQDHLEDSSQLGEDGDTEEGAEGNWA